MYTWEAWNVPIMNNGQEQDGTIGDGGGTIGDGSGRPRTVPNRYTYDIF